MKLKQHFSGAAFISIFLIVSLTCSLTIPPPSQQPQPDRSVKADIVPGDEHWMPRFILNGGGEPITLATDGTNLYAGGYFSIIGGVRANGIAKWNASTNRWSALASGVNDAISSLAVDRTGNFYAGGYFTEAGSVAANHIARWDGNRWSALGSGLNGAVNALAVDDNGNVYIGGYFSTAGSVLANNVAKWDATKNQWETLDAGLDGEISTLAVDRNGNVYAGGIFTSAGSLSANYIARWDGRTWNALGAGISGGSPDGTRVKALAVDNDGNLYAGGDFTLAGTVNVNNIAKWDGRNWSALASGLSGGSYRTSPRALAVYGGNLYAAGDFTIAGGVSANHVARWNGNNWEGLSSGTNDLTSGLAIDQFGNVYVSGHFTTAGDVGANNIARWNGQNWSVLGYDNSINSTALALAVDESNNVYVGGAFTAAGGRLVHQIARWNGSDWSELGDGMSGNPGYCDGYIGSCVLALSMYSSSNLYAGGTFTMTAGINTNHIARWDGSNWSALGSGLNGRVKALAVDANGNVYAGGSFSIAGDVPATNVAKWNVTTNHWEALGSGLDGGVLALAVDKNGNLYAGGGFTKTVELLLNHVAKWNGSTWSALGTGVCCGHISKYGLMDLTEVSALAVDHNGNLYVGGDFTVAGDIYASYVAMWNGINWQSLGSGITQGYAWWGPHVYAVATDTSNNLFVGGDIAMAGDIPVEGIALWNGSSWSALGSGLFGEVDALAVDKDGNLYAGGSLSTAGEYPSVNLAKWTAQIFQLYIPWVAP